MGKAVILNVDGESKLEGSLAKKPKARILSSEPQKTEKAEPTPEGLEFPDIPEITEIPSEDLGFFESIMPTLKTGLTVNPKEKARIIEQHFRGDNRLGSVTTDKFDNPMVTWKGKPYYVNKPGISGADATDVAAQAAQFMPASKVAAGGLGLWNKAARALPGYATTSAAQQSGVVQTGGKPSIDPMQLAFETGTGTLAEAAMPVVGKHVVEPITSRVGPPMRRGMEALGQRLAAKYPQIAARLTGTARQPAMTPVPPVVAPQAAQAAEEVLQPVVDSSGVAQSRYPLTQGQRTQDPAQLNREDILRNTPEGGVANRRVVDFDDRQLAAIQDDAAGLQPGRSGFEPGTMTDIGQRTQESLIDRAAQLKGEADAAFTSAAEMSAEQPAIVTREGVLDFIGRMKQVPRDNDVAGRQMDQMPHLKSVMGYLNRLQKTAMNPRFKDQNFKRLESVRQSFNTDYRLAYDANPKGNEARLIRQVIEQLDQGIDDAITSGLITGDAATIAAVKEARTAWRRYSGFAGGNKKDPATAIMEKILDPVRSTPEDVVRAIFGVSKIDNSARARNVMQRIIKEFGKDSPEVASLKDAFLFRTFVIPRKGDTPVTRTAIVKQFTENFLKNKTIAKTLFSEPEIKNIEGFVQNVAPTLPAEAIRNPSGSAYTIIGSMLDKYGMLFGPINNYRRTFVDISDAMKATSQATPRTSQPLLTAPIAGTAAPTVQQEIDERMP